MQCVGYNERNNYYCCWGFRAKGVLDGGPFRTGVNDMEWWKRTSKHGLFYRIDPGASPRPVFHYLRFLLAKGTQWVCGGVEETGVGFQKRVGPTRRHAQLLMVLQPLNQENPPYTSAVLQGGGLVSVQQMRSLADDHDWLWYNMVKGGHNGPEETTYTKQGFELHTETGIANGWRAGGMGFEGLGKWIKMTFVKTFSNCFDGSRELIPIFFV